MYQHILDVISRYNRIIIHRHTNPDGDAMGSQIGLKHLILANYPQKEVYMVGDAPKRYGFMEGAQMDEIPDSYYADALAIILDTSASHLISDNRYQLAKETLRIDHHIFCEEIAGTELVDTTFESCAGLLANIAYEMKMKLSPLAAKSFYTGMVTDSGRFRYDSTTARTFTLAAYLMGEDFSINDIYCQLYADEYESMRRRAEFVLKIKFTEHNVAYIYTTAEEVEASGMDIFSISRGMVGTMSDIRGVPIWVNFTETENGVLCELRSNKYNINPIAVKYGGGGHAKASGATVKNREEAMRMLSDLDQMNQGE